MCHHCAGLPRRAVLGGLAATALAAAGPAPPGEPRAAISGDEALHRLMQGNARYRGNRMDLRDFAAGRAARVATHRPTASVLSCSDARVAPEFLFDQGPGELFVVRVAGNVLTDEGLASLEYAAQFLNSPLVFVLGHRGCGAVEAAIKATKDNASLPGHLPGLIDRVKPAVAAAETSHPANLLNAAIAENVRRNVQAVGAAQPLLAAMVAARKVKVAGGVYDIATGAVSLT
jgi:carbonic anhydrase